MLRDSLRPDCVPAGLVLSCPAVPDRSISATALYALVADWQVEALPDSAQWANAFVVSNCARRLCNDPRCSQHVLLQGASLETRLNWEAHIRLCIDALRSLEAAPYVASSS